MGMKCGVVIAAGGSGTRFGASVPKQFVDVCGIPVIAHTIRKFQASDYVDEIVIVTHKDYVVFCNDVAKEFNFTKVTTIIEGGYDRQESVFKGLKAAKSEYILIHDAARPMVSTDDIDNCCRSLMEYDCCSLGSRVVDTLKISEDGQFIEGTLDRSKIWSIQTPQCFKRDIILKCHKNAVFDKFIATDDCMLAEKYGYKIKLIEAQSNNLKITNQRDLSIAEVLLNV